MTAKMKNRKLKKEGETSDSLMPINIEKASLKILDFNWKEIVSFYCKTNNLVVSLYDQFSNLYTKLNNGNWYQPLELLPC